MPDTERNWIEVPPGPRPRVLRNEQIARRLERLARELQADIVTWGDAIQTCHEAASRLRGAG